MIPIPFQSTIGSVLMDRIVRQQQTDSVIHLRIMNPIDGHAHQVRFW